MILKPRLLHKRMISQRELPLMITCHFLTIHHLSTVLSLLTSANKKNLLELKESQLLMIDRPSLNRKIRSSPLDLYDKQLFRLTPF